MICPPVNPRGAGIARYCHKAFDRECRAIRTEMLTSRIVGRMVRAAGRCPSWHFGSSHAPILAASWKLAGEHGNSHRCGKSCRRALGRGNIIGISKIWGSIVGEGSEEPLSLQGSPPYAGSIGRSIAIYPGTAPQTSMVFPWREVPPATRGSRRSWHLLAGIQRAAEGVGIASSRGHCIGQWDFITVIGLSLE
jgi:hypothetical protein